MKKETKDNLWTTLLIVAAVSLGTTAMVAVETAGIFNYEFKTLIKLMRKQDGNQACTNIEHKVYGGRYCIVYMGPAKLK